ncbi:hypothetical protein Tco_1507041 [Tanacetum coccineum]
MGIQNGGEKDLKLIERVVITKKVHLLKEEEADEAVVPLELIPSKQEALVPILERLILMYRNETGQGLAHKPVIMGVSYDLRGDSWGCVPRSLFWREDLDRDGEHGFDYLTFALVSSKASREGCRPSRGGFPYW